MGGVENGKGTRGFRVDKGRVERGPRLPLKSPLRVNIAGEEAAEREEGG